MRTHFLPLSVFLAGLAVVGWIAAGYLGANALALLFTLLIGACYVVGALELWRYRQATATLARAVADLSEPPPDLGDWLQRLHPSLRAAVRQRIEHERVALPGPALTPYLVGLLVLLGMLGTLLGMMATLRGTGLALESATDLAAIRASLAAPVKGLGFAFGTSIAGVASSAMLGLLSALLRRDRAQAAQRLDAGVATTLRVHTQSHRREQGFRLLQRQAELMPVLVDRLQAMMDALEQRAAAADERQAAQQQALLERTGSAYAQLASSVAQSLQQAAAEGARSASAAVQPAVDETMAALAREAATLHAGIAASVDRQLQALSSGIGATTAAVSEGWQQLLAGQRQSNEALAQDLRDTLDGFGTTFGQRSLALVDGVSSRLDAHVAQVGDAWEQAMARQSAAGDALAARNEQALSAAAAAFETHAAALVERVAQAHAELQSALAGQDRQRLASWNDALTATGTALREDWRQAGAQVAERQQAICDALARAAQEIGEQSKAHAGDTIAAVSRLVQTASEAPRAAAEVVAELREKLSDSMVRDTAMLEERNRLMATLETLLEGVTHASTGQRAAIDALVATSAELMERVGARFDARIASEAGKLDLAAAQVAAGAAEVASLGDAFGAVVERFGQSSEALATRLQQVEDALGRSLARSDEQLAYYVAQAREVIDLSLLTQKQVVEDLQRLAANNAAGGDAEAA